MVAPAILDRDRRIQSLGLGTDVVFPGDPAGLRLEGHDESTAGRTAVKTAAGIELLERAAARNHLAVREDRRGEKHVRGMGAGKALGSCTQLPTFRTTCPVQRIKPAADIAEVDGVIGYERRAEDPFGRGLEADRAFLLVTGLCRRASLPLRASWIAVGPADLAVWRQLVKGRIGGRSEIDVAIHDDRRGMNDPDLKLRALGGEAPFLLELAGIGSVDSRLTPVVARAGEVAIVHRPVFPAGLSMSHGRREKYPQNSHDHRSDGSNLP